MKNKPSNTCEWMPSSLHILLIMTGESMLSKRPVIIIAAAYFSCLSYFCPVFTGHRNNLCLPHFWCKLADDFSNQIKKSNLHHTRGITPNRVTSSEAHLHGLAPGQHSSEETSQRWRAVGDTVPI